MTPRPSSNIRRHLLMRTAIGAALALAGAGLAQAQVSGAVVAGGGSAAITATGATTDVRLSQPRTIIDWKTFNVAQGQTVNFDFHSGTDIVLNRTPGTLTVDGAVNGMVGGRTGGNVWLYGGSGVIFGPNAQVNVGGLMAMTAPIGSEADFLAGKSSLSFQGGAPDVGVLVKAGARLHADGALALIAPSVTTEAGSVVTAGGTATYAAADNYTIRFAPSVRGDFDLFDFEVPASALQDGTISATPLALAGSTTGANVVMASVSRASLARAVISLDGQVTAQSASLGADGAVVLSATGAPTDVKATGAIRADRSVTMAAAGGDITLLGNVLARAQDGQGGTIRLGDASTHSVAQMTGTVLDASSTGAGQAGGSVVLTAHTAGGDGLIDVSAPAGGGSIALGGGFHGADATIANADYALVGPNALLNASATQSGGGGDVVVWSNLGTSFSGRILSQGGAVSGDGGQAEVSSHGDLGFFGNADLRAAHGLTGTLLLDPNDVTISDTDASNPTPVFSGSGVATYNGNPSSGSTILDTDIDTQLGTSNVSITTNGSITFASGAAVNYTGATARTLSLTANNDVSNVRVSSTTGALGVTIDTTGASSTNGDVTFGTISTNGGAVSVTGNHAITVSNTFNTGGGNVSLTGAGAVTISGAVDAGSGAITLSGGSLALNDNLAGGATTLTANGGAITQGAGHSLTATTLTAQAPGSSISLTGANSLGAVQQFNADTIALTTNGSVTIGAGTVGTEFLFGGSAGVSLASSLPAGHHRVDLTLRSTGGAISFADASDTFSALSLTAAGTVGSGTTTAITTTTGALSLSGTSVTAGALNANTTLGAAATGGNLTIAGATAPGQITLSAANGDLASSGDVTSTGGSNGGVSLTTTGASGKITLSDGGSPATYFNALTTSGDMTVNATGDVNLQNASSTNGNVTLSTTGTTLGVHAAPSTPAISGADVTLNANTISVAGNLAAGHNYSVTTAQQSSLPGTISVGNNYAIDITVGDYTATQALGVPGLMSVKVDNGLLSVLAVSGAGVTLTGESVTLNDTINAGTALNDTFTINATNGLITRNGVSITADKIVARSLGALSLGALTAAHGISLTGDSIDVNGSLSAANGTVALAANTGSVTQDLGTTVTAANVTGSAAAGFTLANAGNAIGGIGSGGVFTTGAGGIDIESGTGNFTINGDVGTPGGLGSHGAGNTIVLKAADATNGNGQLTLNQGATIGGYSVDLESAGPMTLSGIVRAESVYSATTPTRSASNTVTLVTTDTSPKSNITLTQTSSPPVTGEIHAGVLNVNAAGKANLDGTVDVDTVNATLNGDSSFNLKKNTTYGTLTDATGSLTFTANNHDLTFTGDISATAVTVTGAATLSAAAVTATTGAVSIAGQSLSFSGAISGATGVTLGSSGQLSGVSASSTTGATSLTGQTVAFTGAVGGATGVTVEGDAASHAPSIVSLAAVSGGTGAVSITTPNATSGTAITTGLISGTNTVTVDGTSGAAQGGAVSIGGVSSGATTVSLKGIGLTSTGVVFGTAVTADAGGGTLSLAPGLATTAGGTGNVTLSGGLVTTGVVDVGGNYALTGSSFGGGALAPTFTGATGNYDLTATADFIQPGRILTAPVGNLTINGGAHNVSLIAADSSAGQVSVSGASVTLTGASGAVSGYQVNATGAGGVNVASLTTSSGVLGVSSTGGGVTSGGLGSSTGTVAVSGLGAVQINGTASAGGAQSPSVSLTSTGSSLTVAGSVVGDSVTLGAATSLSVSGTLAASSTTVSAGSGISIPHGQVSTASLTNTGAGAILFDQSGSAVGLTVGALSTGGGPVTIKSGGDLALSALGGSPTDVTFQAGGALSGLTNLNGTGAISLSAGLSTPNEALTVGTLTTNGGPISLSASGAITADSLRATGFDVTANSTSPTATVAIGDIAGRNITVSGSGLQIGSPLGVTPEGQLAGTGTVSLTAANGVTVNVYGDTSIDTLTAGTGATVEAGGSAALRSASLGSTGTLTLVAGVDAVLGADPGAAAGAANVVTGGAATAIALVQGGDNATVNLAGPANITTATAQAGDLDVAGSAVTLANGAAGGTMTVNASAGDAAVTNASGASVNVTASGAAYLRHVVITAPLQNPFGERAGQALRGLAAAPQGGFALTAAGGVASLGRLAGESASTPAGTVQGTGAVSGVSVAVDVTGDLDLSSATATGGGATIHASGAVNVGQASAAGALAIAAGAGDATVAQASSTGALTIAADTGNVALGQGAAGGAVTLTSNTGNVSGAGLSGNGVSVQALSGSASLQGPVASTGTLDVKGRSVTVGAAGAASSAGGAATLTSTAGDVTLAGTFNGAGLTLAANGGGANVTGTATASGAGSVTATGGLNIASLTADTLTLRGSDLTLTQLLQATRACAAGCTTATLTIGNTQGGLNLGDGVSGPGAMNISAAELAAMKGGLVDLYAGDPANPAVRGNLAVGNATLDGSRIGTLELFAGSQYGATLSGVLAPGAGGNLVVGSADPTLGWTPRGVIVSGGLGVGSAHAAAGAQQPLQSVTLNSLGDVIIGNARFVTAIDTAIAGSAASTINITRNIPVGVEILPPDVNRTYITADTLTLRANGVIVSQNSGRTGDPQGILITNAGRKPTTLTLGRVGAAPASGLAPSLIDLSLSYYNQNGVLLTNAQAANGGGISLSGLSLTDAYKVNGCSIGAGGNCTPPPNTVVDVSIGKLVEGVQLATEAPPQTYDPTITGAGNEEIWRSGAGPGPVAAACNDKEAGACR